MMTPEFLQRSCLSYDQVKMTFWDDKKAMHKTCLFTDAWRWFTNTYPGADVPQFVDILVLMVKTGHYFPNQQWVLKPQGTAFSIICIGRHRMKVIYGPTRETGEFVMSVSEV